MRRSAEFNAGVAHHRLDVPDDSRSQADSRYLVNTGLRYRLGKHEGPEPVESDEDSR